MGNDESFTAFDLDGNCNFKLLDKNDEIKFYPNDNYYTTENIETLPQIKFYAWDQTFQSNDDCISSLDNRLSFDSLSNTIKFKLIFKF